MTHSATCNAVGCGNKSVSTTRGGKEERQRRDEERKERLKRTRKEKTNEDVRLGPKLPRN